MPHSQRPLPDERLWPVEPAARFVPYATALCAIVEMQASGPRGKKRLLATCEITRLPGARGRYEAAFMEDCFDDTTIDPFVHRPARLDHWQLLQTALAWRLAGEEALPPRPFIFQPEPVHTAEGIKVRLNALAEPAQTCFAVAGQTQAPGGLLHRLGRREDVPRLPARPRMTVCPIVAERVRAKPGEKKRTRSGCADFHMSKAAVTLTLEDVYAMTDHQVHEMWVQQRWGSRETVVCPHCGTIDE